MLETVLVGTTVVLAALVAGKALGWRDLCRELETRIGSDTPVKLGGSFVYIVPESEYAELASLRVALRDLDQAPSGTLLVVGRAGHADDRPFPVVPQGQPNFDN